MKLIVILTLLIILVVRAYQCQLVLSLSAEQEGHQEVEESKEKQNGDDENVTQPEEGKGGPVKDVETDPGILNTHRNLTIWAMREEMIYHLAKERRKVLGTELKVLDKFIEDYEDSTLKAVEHSILTLDSAKDRAKFVGMGGITSYRMTFRYLEYLQGLTRMYEENGENPLKNYFDQLQLDKGGWPSPIDLKSQMMAFIHVQETYDLSLKEIEAILSPETEEPIDLPALQCYQLGLFALQQEHFWQSIEWLEFAKRKVLEEEDESCSPVLIENALDSAIRTHNRALKTFPEHFSNLYDEPVVKEHYQNDQDDEDKWDPKDSRVKRRNIQLEYFKGLPEDNFIDINFWALCSDYDENLQKDKIKARLFCFYDREKSPYWHIGPMKVEHLSFNPPVMLVHEILTDSDIFKILNRRYDLFQRSAVYGSSQDPNNSTTSKPEEQDKQYEPWIRSSVQFWLPDEIFPKLSKKIEHMTGLKVQGGNASEHLQVVEYVFGRFYGPHRDSLGDATNDTKNLEDIEAEGGDRVATVLFYLNTVEHGGATPFVNLGVSVPPVKGNAVIWYHLWKNGTIIEDTYHGACPVLYGVKRVANKWIRYNSQFQTYKCSLNQLE